MDIMDTNQKCTIIRIAQIVENKNHFFQMWSIAIGDHEEILCIFEIKNSVLHDLRRETITM